MAKTYSATKGVFIQNKMKEGMTNDQARKSWKKSEERKSFEQTKSSSFNERGHDFDSHLNMFGTNWHTSEDL